MNLSEKDKQLMTQFIISLKEGKGCSYIRELVMNCDSKTCIIARYCKNLYCRMDSRLVMDNKHKIIEILMCVLGYRKKKFKYMLDRVCGK